jgi:hypothetical protein
MQRARIRQTGQSAVLFLAFLAAMVGALIVVFNVGQTTNAKMRAMNAADAAAYSGALWEARTLNLQAYLNRAMVANEVAIAQSVSLRSWIDYLKRFINNIDDVTFWIPAWGEAATAIAEGLVEVDEVTQEVLPVAESALRVLNTTTSDAEVVINESGAVIAANLASGVASANGASISAGGDALMVRDAVQWQKFTQTYSKSTGVVPSDGRTRLRAVALDSRDGFTHNRSWQLGSPWVEFELKKQGGTDLLNFDSWKGLDSVQLDTVYIPTKGWTVKVPIGWGGAQAYTREQYGYGQNGVGSNWTSVDGKLAVGVSDTSPNATAFRGGASATAFPNYRDIANMNQLPSPQRVADVHLPFAVEVLISKAAVNTSDNTSATSLHHPYTVLPDGTVIDHHSNFASGDKGVFALSQACVRFSRPYGATRTGGLEYPSLFNPYWRASLATISKTDRVLADSFKGIPESAILEGTGTCT